jgi:hypothetical protein
MSHRHNAEQNHNINVAIRAFEDVAQFKYLGATVTNQTLIQEEIMRRLISGNASDNLVQNLLSICLQSRNLKFLPHVRE